MQSLMGHSYGSLEEGDVERIQMMGTRCEGSKGSYQNWDRGHLCDIFGLRSYMC